MLLKGVLIRSVDLNKFDILILGSAIVFGGILRTKRFEKTGGNTRSKRKSKECLNNFYNYCISIFAGIEI